MGALKPAIQIGIVSTLLMASACSPVVRAYNKLDAAHKNIADSLVLRALDHEALYTLLDTLKPISSVFMLRYPIAADSTHIPGTVSPLRNPAYLDTLEMYERVCRALSTSKKQWILVPFKQTDKGQRNIQIYAADPKTLEAKIAACQAFFGQFGISRLSQPSTVVTMVENSDTYDRWRGYGYLFGYPGYAVDFFVQAGKDQKETGQFVERHFMHIPVFSAKEGYFTYAVSKQHIPSSADSAIYKKGMQTLKLYTSLRHIWVTPKKFSTSSALKYIQKRSK